MRSIVSTQQIVSFTFLARNVAASCVEEDDDDLLYKRNSVGMDFTRSIRAHPVTSRIIFPHSDSE